MTNKILFIEGSTDDSNGDLRQGFRKLLEQKLVDNMPRLVMGNSRGETINKFLNSMIAPKNYALIDLDDLETNKNKTLNDLKLNTHIDFTFFMIQEMEAWFLSQPEILDAFYDLPISKKLAKKNAKEFSNPDKELQNLTKASKKGKYHKIKHGVELLQRLNANNLETYFSDFAELIKKLR